MAKADRFYFENLVTAGTHCCDAADYLSETLKTFDYSNIQKNLAEMHEIEHKGDNTKHQMSEALAKAFVTPVDREDLALISQNIDDVTDTVEEVLQQLYMDKITTILPEALIFAEKIQQCCRLMTDMLKEFCNFKRPAGLKEMIIQLSNVEEECDALYQQAILAIPEGCSILEILYWREIYECLEKCADACEHVGDCVETVVMKNS